MQGPGGQAPHRLQLRTAGRPRLEGRRCSTELPRAHFRCGVRVRRGLVPGPRGAGPPRLRQAVRPIQPPPAGSAGSRWQADQVIRWPDRRGSITLRSWAARLAAPRDLDSRRMTAYWSVRPSDSKNVLAASSLGTADPDLLRGFLW